MQDYSKLVEDLRDGVGYWYMNNSSRLVSILGDAADAIEALQAQVESMDESCKKQLVAMASHVAELQAGVKRLNMRCADCEYASKPWPELEPKRGKWEVKGANRIDCSVCGHSVCFAFGLIDGSLGLYKYCPNCGAKMEVQE